jgi:outer membrane biosynthesis protein TonB
MQRPHSSRLYGLLMLTAAFVAVVALVTAMSAPPAGAQANTRGIAAPARESETPRTERTGTAEPHETEHPRETETPHAEHTGTAEPHETEHPRETETPHAEPRETEHPRETETPHAEGTRTPEPHETEHPRETETPRATTTTVAAGVPGSTTRTFPQTGKAVNGLFLAYWDDRGALAQQGYPISPVMQERSDLNGQTYAVQYFERAVFEYHPENQAPFNVLLSQLGTFQYQQKYGK